MTCRGGFLMIHVNGIVLSLEVKQNGDAGLFVGSTFYRVDRSIVEVLDLAQGSAMMVDDWLRKVRGPNWLRASHREEQAEEKRSEREELARAITEWAEGWARDLRAKYGTQPGLSGIYGRAPTIKGCNCLNYDQKTGEVCDYPASSGYRCEIHADIVQDR